MVPCAGARRDFKQEIYVPLKEETPACTVKPPGLTLNGPHMVSFPHTGPCTGDMDSAPTAEIPFTHNHREGRQCASRDPLTAPAGSQKVILSYLSHIPVKSILSQVRCQY